MHKFKSAVLLIDISYFRKTFISEDFEHVQFITARFSLDNFDRGRINFAMTNVSRQLAETYPTKSRQESRENPFYLSIKTSRFMAAKRVFLGSADIASVLYMRHNRCRQ